MVNAQALQGQWNQIRGELKKKWGQLTEDDLRFNNGNIALESLPPGPSPARGEGAQPVRGETPATIDKAANRLTWLAMEPVTGRTHQLRVHSAAMGWPIVGDNIYGTAPRFTGPPQLLHAREVVVPISKNKAPVRVTAPVPDHMRDWLSACGWNGEDLKTQ